MISYTNVNTNTNIKLREIAVVLTPAVVSLAALCVSIYGLSSAAVVRPESMRMSVYLLIWASVSALEIAIMIRHLRLRRIDSAGSTAICKLGKLRCIEAAGIMTGVFALALISNITGVESLFMCSSLKSTPFISMTFVIASIMLSISAATGETGDLRIVNALMLAAVLISTAAFRSPAHAADWDGVSYSIDAFRIGLGIELFLPLYVVSILPPAAGSPGSVRSRAGDFLRSGIRCSDSVKMSESQVMTRSRDIRVLQISLSIFGLAFTIMGAMSTIKEIGTGTGAYGYIYRDLFISASIVLAAVTADSLGSGTYNRFVVALPPAIKLLSDLLGGTLPGSDVMHAVYIGLTLMAIIGAVRMYKALLAFSQLATITVLLVELCVFCIYPYHSFAEYSSTVALYMAELLISFAILLFVSSEWTVSISDDIVRYLEVDESLDFEVINDEQTLPGDAEEDITTFTERNA